MYNPDKSKIFFINIIDQEILTNDIGYLNVLSIVKYRRIAKEDGILRVNSNLYTNILTSGSKYVKKEKMHLWYSENAIITRLRTEHIKLNLYMSAIYGDGDGICNNCNHDCYETVRHYLVDCPKYEQQREILKQELTKIDENFNNPRKFNARRLLFPHWYQKYPGKLDKLYDRVNILKLVCQYVSSTQRFKDDDKDSIYNLYEMEVKDKISKKIETMETLVNRVVELDEMYYNNDTQEEREEKELKSIMDFYCGNDDVDDDEHINTRGFFNDICD